MTAPEPQAERYVSAEEIDLEPPATAAEWLEADPEAGLGHDYDGPELRSGTPEYEALYAEYQAWAVPDPEPEAEL